MSERDEFEAWLKSTIGAQADLLFMLRDYSNGFTNDLWQAWQAARATLQQEVPALEEPVACYQVQINGAGEWENSAKETYDWYEARPNLGHKIRKLYAAPQPSQEPDRVPERSAMYDRIMSGRYPNPDEATKPSTSFPKYQD